MFKKIIIFSILYFSSTFLLNAEIVNKVIVKGNQKVSDETIKIYGKISIGENYNNSDLDKILKNIYETNFFENVNLELKNNVLTINLKEYPSINQLVILGENSKKYKEQIKKITNLRANSSFIKSNIANDISTIKNFYSSLGYNFTEVDIKVKAIDDAKLDLIVEIKRGDKTRIVKIDFIGNENIRSRRLRDVIASEEHKFWKIISNNSNFTQNLLNLDTRLLKNYYRSLGYYDIKINSNSAQLDQENTIKITFSIDEGKRYIVQKISTNVDDVFDKKIFFPLNELYKEYIGQYYSPFKIKQLLEEVDEIIINNNLQFVEHNVQESFEEDKINIVFNIFESEKILVERIDITGNNVTSEEVIRSELILDEGDPFTILNLDKSIAEIKDRRIFKNVTYEVVDGTKNNLKQIIINVEEKPTGEISAGAGVGTNGGTFAVNVQENNWLGEGKTIGFDLEVDAETLSGTFYYSNPNYNFLGNSLNYSLSSTDNDKPDQGYENSIISAGIGTSFEQYKNVIATLGLNASYDDLRTFTSASDSLKKQEGSFSELNTNYGFTFDKRNRVFRPTSGSLLNFNQTLPIYADKSFIENTIRFSNYKTLSENVVGAAKFYFTSVNGLGDDDVRLSKRKGLSNKRLRGFERNKIGPVDGTDHIKGNYATALNFEASLPNFLPDSTNADVGLYLDFGNVWGVDYDSTIDDGSKIRSSFGALLNWMSPLGPMAFTISQNISKASTDKTESFNFNLGTTF